MSGSTNGWSGQVYVLDGDPDPAGPGDLHPSATLTDVRGPVSVDLGGATGTSALTGAGAAGVAGAAVAWRRAK